MLFGPSYGNVGRWQELRLGDLPRLLARQARILRAELGPTVDEREAYLEGVLLNVYCGPGPTNIWIDDLAVFGHVSASSSPPPASAAATSADRGWSAGLPSSSTVLPASGGEPAVSLARRVQLSGSVLLVEGRPFFPRAVQYRGEPLPVLRRLGFNTVWLEHPPPPQLLAEAAAAGLWLVCPPPMTQRLSPGEATHPILTIGPEFSPVLAWNLGARLTANELETTRRLAQQLRLADRPQPRPVICAPCSELRGYSRECELLVVDRRPLGTSFELREYGEWIRERSRLARPGVPLWATLQTQLDPGLREQLRALDPRRSPPAIYPPEQVQLLAYAALAAGVRGLLVLSESPLVGNDPETAQRAAALELLNLELELLTPWAAAGMLVAYAESNVPEVTAPLLRADRAFLLAPNWLAAGGQYTLPQSAINNLTLTVPGLPEATQVFELAPAALRPLQYRRVAGGTRVSLDEFGPTALVLLAQDPIILAAVSQRVAAWGSRAAELQIYLAEQKAQHVQAVLAQPSGQAVSPPRVAHWLSTAGNNLQNARRLLANRDYPAAWMEAWRAMRALRLVERAYWEKAAATLASPPASPGAVSFATLPWHWQLVDRLADARLGPNLLPGGECENLETMLRSGWQYTHVPGRGIQATVELSPLAAHAGTRGLRLLVDNTEGETKPAVIETPPISITTPPLSVLAGQILCIHGWVHVPKPLQGNRDGLMLYDSLGGEALALRISKTNGWQRFFMYRAVPQSGVMTVQMAHAGLGEVRLDDMAVQVLEPLAVPPPAKP
jgi:hypothetical protein